MLRRCCREEGRHLQRGRSHSGQVTFGAVDELDVFSLSGLHRYVRHHLGCQVTHTHTHTAKPWLLFRFFLLKGLRLVRSYRGQLRTGAFKDAAERIRRHFSCFRRKRVMKRQEAMRKQEAAAYTEQSFFFIRFLLSSQYVCQGLFFLVFILN